VRRADGVVEVAVGEGESRAPAYGVAPPLELIVGDVDPAIGEGPQATLEPLLKDEFPEVARLAAGMTRQHQVGAPYVAIHDALDEPQEQSLAGGEPLADAPTSVVEGERPCQTSREVTREAHGHGGIFRCLGELATDSLGARVRHACLHSRLHRSIVDRGPVGKRTAWRASRLKEPRRAIPSFGGNGWPAPNATLSVSS